MAGIVLKITIMDTHPPVWRRVVVPEKMCFEDLHRVIQIIFGWEDMHLHIFENPGKIFEVVQTKKDAMKSMFMIEKKTPVGAVLEHEKWMCYTYDFGDDWRHKVLFEKKMPEYTADYATVLKVKGDNFVEDFCGDWDEDIQPEIYDIEKVNHTLQKMHFKETDMPDDYDQMMKSITLFKEAKRDFYKYFRKQAEKFLKNLDDNEKKQSAVKKEVTAWKEFCDEKENGNICKMPPRKTCKELIHRLDEQQKRDYSKYLQLPCNYEDEDPEILADAINEELMEHPEYYLYILTEKNISEFEKLSRLEENRKYTTDYNTVMKGIVLGFLHVQIPPKTEAAYVFPAIDFKERLALVTALDLKKYQKEINDITGKITKMMFAYTLLELNDFYKIFEDIWNTKIAEQDFLRYVYWYGSFGKKFQTMRKSDTGKNYAALFDVDSERIIADMEQYAADLSYKKFTQKELLADSQDVADCGECWELLAQELYEGLGLPREEIADLVELIFNEAVSGYSADDILDTIVLQKKQVQKPEVLFERLNTWQLVFECIMTLRLPMLHGYSRMEYEKITGKNAFDTGVFAADRIRDEIAQETSLRNMPVKIQEEIYRAFYENREPDRPKELEKIRKKISVENDELDCLTAMCYMGTGKYSKANSMLEKIAERTEDESVYAMLDMMGGQIEGMSSYYMDYAQDRDPFTGIGMEVDMPYQRESKKIGRNDPCPCGSGKKYKKCCGK